MKTRSTSRGLSGFTAGWTMLAGLWLLALAAPLVANERPLLQRVDGRLYFPARAALPLVGNWVEPHPPKPGQGDLVVYPLLPYSPGTPDLNAHLQPPGPDHLLGTDVLGRDLAARLIHGARSSLLIGAAGTLAALGVGLLLGALAGYFGGRLDWTVSGLVDVALCFPSLLLALALISLTSARGPWALVLVLAATRWARIARFARGEFRRLRQTEMVTAARAGGAGEGRILATHLLPNALAPVLVTASFSAAGAALLEASLGFLGLGVAPPGLSWGTLLATAREHAGTAWWLAVFPGLTVFLTIAGYGLLAEGLLDRLDPRRWTTTRDASAARSQAL